MLLPPTTGSGESVCEMARSADRETVGVAVAELLPAVPSADDAVTVAVSLRTLPAVAVAGTRATTVKVWVAEPATSAARVHVTVPLLPTAGTEQVHPDGLVDDWYRRPAGSGFAKESEVASLGPLLTTEYVYVRSVPATTGSGEPALAVARSALTAVVVCAVAALFPGVPSRLDEPAVAVSLMVVAASDELIFTTSVKVDTAPLAIAEFVQLTDPPADPAAGVVHDHPAGDTGTAKETKVVFVGTESVRVTEDASEGPLLVSVIV
jgi:hypothetical protein